MTVTELIRELKKWRAVAPNAQVTIENGTNNNYTTPVEDVRIRTTNDQGGRQIPEIVVSQYRQGR